MERRIQVSNMPRASSIDASAVQNRIEKYYDKLAKRVPGGLAMDVHFKEGHIAGKGEDRKEQIEAYVKVVVAGGSNVFHAKHVEWHAIKAVRGAMEAIEKESMKALKKN